MKLVTFTHNHRTRVGALEGDRIRMTTWNYDLFRLIQAGISTEVVHDSVPLADVKLHAPYIPGKILGIGRNYAKHAEELNNPLPDAPLIFSKVSSSVIGPGETITWKKSITEQVDWEGELAVIIGKPARYVSEADAMKHVFGYTIANDVSARDLQDKDGQWVRAKGLDTFCPLGPCVVTSDEIADPHKLTVKTKVGNKEMQNASTELLLFKIPHLISYCSQAFTLNPGDMILTGTPAGVGKGMKPPRFLKTGDTVTVSIDGIGELSNPCQIEDE